METIPVVGTADDLDAAIEYATEHQHARWYVGRRAVALHQGEKIPEDWGLVAAFGGNYNMAARKKAAAKGHTAYGTSYPIEDVADLKRAIQAYGRAKNKAAAKAHIIRRARSLGATSLLPKGWLGATASGEEETEVDPQPVETPVDETTDETAKESVVATGESAEVTAEDLAWGAIEALMAFVAAADLESGEENPLAAAATRFFDIANDEALAASGEETQTPDDAEDRSATDEPAAEKEPVEA